MIISISKSRELKPWSQVNFATTEVTCAKNFATLVTANAWSPIVWKEGYRKTDNFIRAELCVLDFDDGAVTVSNAIDQCRDLGLWFLIGATKSHQVAKGEKPACDRFRLILRFSEPITNAPHYVQAMKRIIADWKSDPQACDGARWFAPCRNIVAAAAGNPIDVPQYTPPVVHFNKHQYIWKKEKHLPRWVSEVLTQGIAEGQRNCTIYRVCKSLQKFGWTSDDVLALISKSNILPERELLTVVKSAYR